MQPRHQGGAHGGRATAKIVRAPAKISGLIMLHLVSVLPYKNFGIFGIKDQMATVEAGVDG